MINHNVLIEHGIYEESDVPSPYQRKTKEYIPMSLKLRNYLEEKYKKFGTKIEFTIGSDPHNHIECLAVVHPHYNQFCRRIGKEIVTGRIRRERGELNPKRQAYSKIGEMPPYLFRLTK